MISIIIPTYHGEKTIERALKSVYKNPTNLFEVIVIMDGENEETEKILAKYKSQYGNLSMVVKKNEGVSSARNDGIKLARGKYITFLDDDDEWEEKLLSSIIKNLNEDVDLLVFGRKDISSSNVHYCNDHREIKYYKDIDYHLVNKFCTGTTTFSACNKIYCRKIIVDNNIFFNTNLRYSEDLDFNLRYYEKINNTIVEDYEVNYLRYYNEGSAVCRPIPNFFEFNTKILEEILSQTKYYNRKDIQSLLMSHFTLISLNRIMAGADQNNKPYSKFYQEVHKIYKYWKEKKYSLTYEKTKKNCILFFTFKHRLFMIMYIIFVLIGDIIRRRR